MSMKNTMKPPKIAVFPENNDDDSQKSLILDETHTDIEDFDTTRRVNSKSRLKIKVTTDGYITDMEDLEISDGEEQEYKIPSNTSVLDRFLDLDDGLIEEVQEANGKMVSEKMIKSHNLNVVVDDDDLTTDIEDCYTDNEIEDDITPVINSLEACGVEYKFDEYISEKNVNNECAVIEQKPKRKRKRNRQKRIDTSDDDDNVENNTLAPSATKIDDLTDIEDVVIDNNNTYLTFPDEDKTDVESLISVNDLMESLKFDDQAADELFLEKKFTATQCAVKTNNELLDWKEFIKIGAKDSVKPFLGIDLPTDEESLTDFDDYQETNRVPTPNLQMFEETVECHKEKAVNRSLLKKVDYISDSEEVVIAGDQKNILLTPKLDEDCLTEVEDFVDDGVRAKKKFVTTSKIVESSDDENITFSRAPTATLQQIRNVQTDFEDDEDSQICRKRLSVDLAEDKIVLTVKHDVSLKKQNYTVKFGITSDEGKLLFICF